MAKDSSITNLIYYVYKHTDPRNNEIIYIGHGCRGRAWIHGSKRSCLRSQEHLNHLEDLITHSFLPNDWVEITHRGLNKREACRIENEFIRDVKPKYNKPQGIQHLKVTPDILQECLELHKNGMSYSNIADKVDLSTMTIYRALNNQTKNLGDVYAK